MISPQLLIMVIDPVSTPFNLLVIGFKDKFLFLLTEWRLVRLVRDRFVVFSFQKFFQLRFSLLYYLLSFLENFLAHNSFKFIPHTFLLLYRFSCEVFLARMAHLYFLLTFNILKILFFQFKRNPSLQFDFFQLLSNLIQDTLLFFGLQRLFNMLFPSLFYQLWNLNPLGSGAFVWLDSVEVAWS